MASWRGLGRGLTAASQALTGLPGIFAELGKEERAEERYEADLARQGDQAIDEIGNDATQMLNQGYSQDDMIKKARSVGARFEMSPERIDEAIDRLIPVIEGSRARLIDETTSSMFQAAARAPNIEAARRERVPFHERRESLGSPIDYGGEPIEAPTSVLEDRDPISREWDLGEAGDGAPSGEFVSVEFGSPAELYPEAGPLTPEGHKWRGIEERFIAEERDKEKKELERQQRENEEWERRYQIQRRDQEDHAVYMYTLQQRDQGRVQVTTDSNGNPVYVTQGEFGLLQTMGTAAALHFIQILRESQEKRGLLPSASEPVGIINGERVGSTSREVLGRLSISLEGLPDDAQTTVINNLRTGTSNAPSLIQLMAESSGRYEEQLITDFKAAYQKLRNDVARSGVRRARAATGGGAFDTGGVAADEMYLQETDPYTRGVIDQNVAVEIGRVLMDLKKEAVDRYGEERGLAMAHRAFFLLADNIQMRVDALDNAGEYAPNSEYRWLLENAYAPDQGEGMVWVENPEVGGGLDVEPFILVPYGDYRAGEIKPPEATGGQGPGGGYGEFRTPELSPLGATESSSQADVIRLKEELAPYFEILATYEDWVPPPNSPGRANPYVDPLNKAKEEYKSQIRDYNDSLAIQARWEEERYGFASVPGTLMSRWQSRNNFLPTGGLFPKEEEFGGEYPPVIRDIAGMLQYQRQSVDNVQEHQMRVSVSVGDSPEARRYEQERREKDPLRYEALAILPIDRNRPGGLSLPQENVAKMQDEGMQGLVRLEDYLYERMYEYIRGAASAEISEGWKKALASPNLTWPGGTIAPPPEFFYIRTALVEMQQMMASYDPKVMPKIGPGSARIGKQ